MQKLPYNLGKLKNTSPNDIYLPKKSQLNTKQQLPFGKLSCCRPTVLNLQISVNHGRLLKFKALKNTKASCSMKYKIKKMLTISVSLGLIHITVCIAHIPQYTCHSRWGLLLIVQMFVNLTF